MASQPTEMSSRNWMMRRMIIDGVRNDPAWKGGDYTEQPQAFRMANVFFGISTIGGTLAYQKQAPTRELADKLLEQRIAAATKADANDFLYYWDSSRDYNASPGSSASRRRCSPSTRPTTSAIRPRPASWSAS